MVLAGDGDRERAAASLREHFISGRLTVDELSARTELVLRARSLEELRRALAGLPQFNLRAAARSAVRGGMLLLLTAAWLLFSLALFVVFGLTLLIHGISMTVLVAVLLVWLVPTVLLSRLWRPRRSERALGS
jgi:Flp pilus assembly protein TadB